MFTIALNNESFDPNIKYIEEQRLDFQSFNKKELYNKKAISINIGVCVGSFLIGGFIFSLLVFFFFSTAEKNNPNKISTPDESFINTNLQPSDQQPSDQQPSDQQLIDKQLLDSLSSTLQINRIKTLLENNGIIDPSKLLNEATALLPLLWKFYVSNLDLKSAGINEPKNLLEQLKNLQKLIDKNKSYLEFFIKNIEELKDLLVKLIDFLERSISKQITTNQNADISNQQDVLVNEEKDQIKQTSDFDETKIKVIENEMKKLKENIVRDAKSIFFRDCYIFDLFTEKTVYRDIFKKCLTDKYQKNKQDFDSCLNSYSIIYQKKAKLNEVINELKKIMEFLNKVLEDEKNIKNQLEEETTKITSDQYLKKIKGEEKKILNGIIIEKIEKEIDLLSNIIKTITIIWEQKIPSIEEKREFKDEIDYIELSKDFINVIGSLEEEANRINQEINENKQLSKEINENKQLSSFLNFLDIKNEEIIYIHNVIITIKDK